MWRGSFGYAVEGYATVRSGRTRYGKDRIAMVRGVARSDGVWLVVVCNGEVRRGLVRQSKARNA